MDEIGKNLYYVWTFECKTDEWDGTTPRSGRVYDGDINEWSDAHVLYFHNKDFKDIELSHGLDVSNEKFDYLIEEVSIDTIADMVIHPNDKEVVDNHLSKPPSEEPNIETEKESSDFWKRIFNRENLDINTKNYDKMVVPYQKNLKELTQLNMEFSMSLMDAIDYLATSFPEDYEGEVSKLAVAAHAKAMNILGANAFMREYTEDGDKEALFDAIALLLLEVTRARINNKGTDK